MKDTWCALTPADQIEASCVNDTGLATPCQVHLQCHLEEHEGRVNAVLVQFQHVPQLSQPPLGCMDQIKMQNDHILVTIGLSVHRSLATSVVSL